jgi:hypothetical protein
MSDIVLHIEGFELRADNRDDEPRIRDIDLAERAGMKTPRQIRVTIRHAVKSGLLKDVDYRRLERRDLQRGETVDVSSYLLTETGALKVVTRINTDKARAMVGLMVQVFRRAMGELRPVLPPPAAVPVLADVANAARMKDTPEGIRDVKALSKAAATAMKVSVAKVHGAIRHQQNVASPYAISVLVWTLAVKPMLYGMIEGKLTLAPPARKLRLIQGGANPHQGSLFPGVL